MSRGAMAISALFLLAALAQTAGADDTTPYVVEHGFDGHLLCAASTPALRVAACSIAGLDSFTFAWTLHEGLETLIIDVQWDQAPLGAHTLHVLVEENVCGNAGCNDAFTYAIVDGPSPMHIRIDDSDIWHPDFQWNAIVDERDIRMRVFPGDDPPIQVVIDQPFQVTVQEYYHAAAP